MLIEFYATINPDTFNIFTILKLTFATFFNTLVATNQIL
jgi:hypothetical protein